MWLALKAFLSSGTLIKIGAVALVAASIWGHGYYTAHRKWDRWYQAERIQQETINKAFEERGRQEALRIMQEEAKDEDISKQNEQEAQKDPNRDSPALSRGSVQRLQRF